GKLLLIADTEGWTSLCTVLDGKPLRQSLAHSSYAQSVAFSPDSATFVVANADGTVQCYDTSSDRPCGAALRHPQVFRVAFSPDGKPLATGGHDQMAWLWDLATAQPRCAPLQHQGSVLSLSFRPDGKTLLTGSKDRAARLWDVSTGLRIGPLLVHEGPVL